MDQIVGVEIQQVCMAKINDDLKQNLQFFMYTFLAFYRFYYGCRLDCSSYQVYEALNSYVGA